MGGLQSKLREKISQKGCPSAESMPTPLKAAFTGLWSSYGTQGLQQVGNI